MKTKLDKPIEAEDILIFSDRQIATFTYNEFWNTVINSNIPSVPITHTQEVAIGIELPQMEYQIPNTELQCYLVPKQDREYWLSTIRPLHIIEYSNRKLKSGE